MLLLLVLLGEWATAVVAFVPPLGHAVRHLRHVGAHSGGQQQQLDVRRAEPTEWMAALPLPTVVVQSSSSTSHRRRRLRGSTALMVTNDAGTTTPAELDSLIKELLAALEQERAELEQQIDLARKQPEDQLIKELREAQAALEQERAKVEQEKAEVQQQLEQEKDPDRRKFLEQRILNTDQLILATMKARSDLDNRLNTLDQAIGSTQRPDAVTKEFLNKRLNEENDKTLQLITMLMQMKELGEEENFRRRQQEQSSH